MENLESIFNKWLNKKLNNQIPIIDEICEKTGLNPKVWFKKFLNEDTGMYSGYDFIENLLDSFSVYLTLEFESYLVEYIKPDGYNVNNKPFYGLFINIEDLSEGDIVDFELYIDDEDSENFIKKIECLSLSQKEKLMKNKLFSYIINKTNFQFLSNNDIRALKLKNLNECI